MDIFFGQNLKEKKNLGGGGVESPEKVILFMEVEMVALNCVVKQRIWEW